MALESHGRNPYVGPRPFEQEDKDFFFGRDHEASELLSLITAHRVLLLYAQSGAGKTSLINAKLIPLLEKEQFEVLPLARVQGLIAENIELEQILNLYVFNTLLSWASDGDSRPLTKMSLADFLKDREHLIDEMGQPSPRLIIFDQFEELFSSYPGRWSNRKEFFEQVRDALQEDSFLRVVFIMREDYIAQLEPYGSLLPEKLRTRFRLEHLREEVALSTITGPIDKTDRSFADGVAEKLVENLMKVAVEDDSNSEAITTAGEFIEPVQLQVVCQSLWEQVSQSGIMVITEDHLQAFGDVDEALAGFYERSVEVAAEETNVKKGDLRRWFDRTLITPAKTRGLVFRGQEETGGIPNVAVNMLDSLHLIREELRGGARWYELTHDRLVEPILKSNEKWIGGRWEAEHVRKQLETLETRAVEWVRLGRGTGGLLDEVELREAKYLLQVFDTGEMGYSEDVKALVQDSEAAIEKVKKRKEEAIRRELQQAQVLAEEQERRAEEQEKNAKRFRAYFIAFAILSISAIVFLIIIFFTYGTLQDLKVEVKSVDKKIATADSIARVISDSAKTEVRLAQIQKGSALAQLQDARTKIQFNRSEALRLDTEVTNLKDSVDIQKKALQLQRDEDRLRRKIYIADYLATIAPNRLVIENDTLSVLLALTAYDFNRAVQDSLKQEKFESLRAELKKEPIDLDKEYHALRKTLNRVELDLGGPKTLFDEHSGWVRTIAYSPNGELLASGDEMGNIRLLNLRTGKEDTLQSHNASVRCVAFSPDGMTLASGSNDATIRLWNAQSGPNQEPHVLTGHKDRVLTLAYNSDGTLLASGDADGKLVIWDISNSSVRAETLAHRNGVNAISFYKDGKLLVSGGNDQRIRFWEAKDLKLQRDPLRSTSGVQSLATHQFKNLLAVGHEDGSLSLWNLNDFRIDTTFHLHKSDINSVAFSANGKFLAWSGSDSYVHLWDLQNRRSNPILLDDKTQTVWTIAFSPDNRHLVCGSSDRKGRQWVAHTDQLAQIAREKYFSSFDRHLSQAKWNEFIGNEIPYPEIKTTGELK